MDGTDGSNHKRVQIISGVRRDNLIAGDNDLSDISPFLGGLELNWRIFSKIGCFLTKKMGDVKPCITFRRRLHEFVIRHFSAMHYPLLFFTYFNQVIE